METDKEKVFALFNLNEKDKPRIWSLYTNKEEDINIVTIMYSTNTVTKLVTN